MSETTYKIETTNTEEFETFLKGPEYYSALFDIWNEIVFEDRDEELTVKELEVTNMYKKIIIDILESHGVEF